MDGIPFVAKARHQLALASVTIDVQDLWGRESLVAYSSGYAAGC